MKTKKKNQNKIIKIAAALMILCLMTTCAISATFAKYATTDSTADTARVAKWGVVLSASGTLFGKNYAANTATSNSDAIIAASASHSASTHSVVAGAKAVAPGTKNDVGVQLKLTGTPEVAYSVAASTTSSALEDIYLKAGTYGVMVVAYGLNAATDITQYYVLEGTSYKPATGSYVAGTDYYQLLDYVNVTTDYYPVVWTLKTGNADAFEDGGTPIETTYANVTELTNAMKDYVNGDGETSKEYKANEILDQMLVATWAWEYENDTDTDADKKDTILGNIGYTTVVQLSGSDYIEIQEDRYNLEVGFNITISAEQID